MEEWCMWTNNVNILYEKLPYMMVPMQKNWIEFVGRPRSIISIKHNIRRVSFKAEWIARLGLKTKHAPFMSLVLYWCWHATQIKKSCHTYEGGTSQTYKGVTPHIWRSHVTHMKESCHTSGKVVTHKAFTSYVVAHMMESCHTYERRGLVSTLHDQVSFTLQLLAAQHCDTNKVRCFVQIYSLL